MPIPKPVTRFNRRVANPLIGLFAGRLPPLAMVIHRGRQTGRRHETPVFAFVEGSTVTIPLTYGTDIDWLKNVRAAERCMIIRRGQRQVATNPRLLPPGEGRRRMPRPIQLFLRLLRVDDFLEVTIKEPTAGSGTER